jgi:asparagine synthase (glutamine-hydrolysing)
LIADVPVGLFLSSGIDSSVLLAAAAELGLKPKTVTLGFEEFRGTSLDESVLAEKTARYYGSDHETVFLNQKQIEDSIDDFFNAMDQPTTDGLNTWLVSNVAHKLGLKAALSGVGADEFLGGYPSFWQIQELLRTLGPIANIPKFGKMIRKICYPALRKMKKSKHAGMLEYSSNMSRAFFLRRAQIMPYELHDVFYHTDVLEGVYDKCLSQFLNYEKNTEREVERLLHIGGNFMAISYLEASNYMANRLLVDSDWAGMNHSLEIRMPFVDLVFVSGVIEKMKTSKPYTKNDLASSLNISLSDEIRLRKKTGFSVPVKALSRFGKKFITDNARWSNTIFTGYMKSLQ